MGRSPRTIAWYEQKMSWYLDHECGPASLAVLTAFEPKRLLASLQERNLAPNTIHGFFQVVHHHRGSEWGPAAKGHPDAAGGARPGPGVARVRVRTGRLGPPAWMASMATRAMSFWARMLLKPRTPVVCRRPGTPPTRPGVGVRPAGFTHRSARRRGPSAPATGTGSGPPPVTGGR